MDPTVAEPTAVHHTVAMPFPLHGHINAMMSLSKLTAITPNLKPSPTL